MTKHFWTLASFAFAAAMIGLWQLQSGLGLISTIYLPSPAATWNALVRGFESGVLVSRTWGTIERMIYGWLLASLVGVIIGAIIGNSKTARDYLQPFLEYLRPMPASAVIPVAIPILGLTDSMVLTVTCFASLWPTLLGTVHGFSSVEPRLAEVSKIMRLSRIEYIFKIALPNAVPDILAGMRLSLTYALILSVVGEMLASRDGLGSWILQASRFYQAPNVFAGVALLGLIGYLSSVFMNQLERRLLRWRATH
ncbi:MAG: ABC transporter permease [Pelagibacterium sp. SCN 64-44]|nr:MAG: ABC transporter permease [Pelagibacterium sp. SCN 64-44]